MQIIGGMQWSQIETRDIGDNNPIEHRSDVNTEKRIDSLE